MNLKEKIEEWEKTKHEISPWPWAEISAGDILDSKEKQVILSFHHNESLQYRLGKNAEVNLSFITSAPENYDAAMQALKEAAEVIDGLMGHPETECPCPVLAKRWRKKWGFEK